MSHIEARQGQILGILPIDPLAKVQARVAELGVAKSFDEVFQEHLNIQTYGALEVNVVETQGQAVSKAESHDAILSSDDASIQLADDTSNDAHPVNEVDVSASQAMISQVIASQQAIPVQAPRIQKSSDSSPKAQLEKPSVEESQKAKPSSHLGADNFPVDVTQDVPLNTKQLDTKSETKQLSKSASTAPLEGQPKNQVNDGFARKVKSAQSESKSFELSNGAPSKLEIEPEKKSSKNKEFKSISKQSILAEARNQVDARPLNKQSSEIKLKSAKDTSEATEAKSSPKNKNLMADGVEVAKNKSPDSLQFASKTKQDEFVSPSPMKAESRRNTNQVNQVNQKSISLAGLQTETKPSAEFQQEKLSQNQQSQTIGVALEAGLIAPDMSIEQVVNLELSTKTQSSLLTSEQEKNDHLEIKASPNVSIKDIDQDTVHSTNLNEVKLHSNQSSITAKTDSTNQTSTGFQIEPKTQTAIDSGAVYQQSLKATATEITNREASFVDGSHSELLDAIEAATGLKPQEIEAHPANPVVEKFSLKPKLVENFKGHWLEQNSALKNIAHQVPGEASKPDLSLHADKAQLITFMPSERVSVKEQGNLQAQVNPDASTSPLEQHLTSEVELPVFELKAAESIAFTFSKTSKTETQEVFPDSAESGDFKAQVITQEPPSRQTENFKKVAERTAPKIAHEEKRLDNLAKPQTPERVSVSEDVNRPVATYEKQTQTIKREERTIAEGAKTDQLIAVTTQQNSHSSGVKNIEPLSHQIPLIPSTKIQNGHIQEANDLLQALSPMTVSSRFPSPKDSTLNAVEHIVNQADVALNSNPKFSLPSYAGEATVSTQTQIVELKGPLDVEQPQKSEVKLAIAPVAKDVPYVELEPLSTKVSNSDKVKLTATQQLSAQQENRHDVAPTKSSDGQEINDDKIKTEIGTTRSSTKLQASEFDFNPPQSITRNELNKPDFAEVQTQISHQSPLKILVKSEQADVDVQDLGNELSQSDLSKTQGKLSGLLAPTDNLNPVQINSLVEPTKVAFESMGESNVLDSVAIQLANPTEFIEPKISVPDSIAQASFHIVTKDSSQPMIETGEDDLLANSKKRAAEVLSESLPSTKSASQVIKVQSEGLSQTQNKAKLENFNDVATEITTNLSGSSFEIPEEEIPAVAVYKANTSSLSKDSSGAKQHVESEIPQPVTSKYQGGLVLKENATNHQYVEAFNHVKLETLNTVNVEKVFEQDDEQGAQLGIQETHQLSPIANRVPNSSNAGLDEVESSYSSLDSLDKFAFDQQAKHLAEESKNNIEFKHEYSRVDVQAQDDSLQDSLINTVPVQATPVQMLPSKDVQISQHVLVKKEVEMTPTLRELPTYVSSKDEVKTQLQNADLKVFANPIADAKNAQDAATQTEKNTKGENQAGKTFAPYNLNIESKPKLIESENGLQNKASTQLLVAETKPKNVTETQAMHAPVSNIQSSYALQQSSKVKIESQPNILELAAPALGTEMVDVADLELGEAENRSNANSMSVENQTQLSEKHLQRRPDVAPLLYQQSSPKVFNSVSSSYDFKALSNELHIAPAPQIVPETEIRNPDLSEPNKGKLVGVAPQINSAETSGTALQLIQESKVSLHETSIHQEKASSEDLTFDALMPAPQAELVVQTIIQSDSATLNPNIAKIDLEKEGSSQVTATPLSQRDEIRQDVMPQVIDTKFASNNSKIADQVKTDLPEISEIQTKASDPKPDVEKSFEIKANKLTQTIPLTTMAEFEAETTSNTLPIEQVHNETPLEIRQDSQIKREVMETSIEVSLEAIAPKINKNDRSQTLLQPSHELNTRLAEITAQQENASSKGVMLDVIRPAPQPELVAQAIIQGGSTSPNSTVATIDSANTESIRVSPIASNQKDELGQEDRPQVIRTNMASNNAFIVDKAKTNLPEIAVVPSQASEPKPIVEADFAIKTNNLQTQALHSQPTSQAIQPNIVEIEVEAAKSTAPILLVQNEAPLEIRARSESKSQIIETSFDENELAIAPQSQLGIASQNHFQPLGVSAANLNETSSMQAEVKPQALTSDVTKAIHTTEMANQNHIEVSVLTSAQSKELSGALDLEYAPIEGAPLSQKNETGQQITSKSIDKTLASDMEFFGVKVQAESFQLERVKPQVVESITDFRQTQKAGVEINANNLHIQAKAAQGQQTENKLTQSNPLPTVPELEIETSAISTSITQIKNVVTQKDSSSEIRQAPKSKPELIETANQETLAAIAPQIAENITTQSASKPSHEVKVDFSPRHKILDEVSPSLLSAESKTPIVTPQMVGQNISRRELNSPLISQPEHAEVGIATKLIKTAKVEMPISTQGDQAQVNKATIERPNVSFANMLEKELSQAIMVQAPLSQASAIQPQSMASQASEPATYQLHQAFGSPVWAEEVNQNVVWMMDNHEHSITLTINPPDMGPLRVEINVNQNKVDANFVTDNQTLRDALRDNTQDLRAMLTQAGIELGQANVSSHQQHQQFQQSAPQFSESAMRSTQQFNRADEIEAPIQQVRRKAVVEGEVDTFA